MEGFFYGWKALHIGFKVSGLHWGGISGTSVFLILLLFQNKQKNLTFSEASEQSLISKHPPLMGNSQITLKDVKKGVGLLVFKIAPGISFTAAFKRHFANQFMFS